MAIPSSGPVSIGSTAGSGRSINVEVGRTQNTANSSMTDVVTAAVVGSTPRGSGTVPEAQPHEFSEWHSYVHVIPDIWEVGTGGTETNYARLASASGANTAARQYGIQANINASTDNIVGNSLRARVINSESGGVYTSNFAIYLYNSYLGGNTGQGAGTVGTGMLLNYRFGVDGVTIDDSTYANHWYPQSWWKMYQAEWTSSTSIADACPDTWNLDWSTSTTQFTVTASTAAHAEFTSGTQITSCDHDSSGHTALNFSDNTDYTYNNTAGVDTWASRAWKDTCHATLVTASPYQATIGQSFSTITFDVTFKKSGYTDTSSTGGGWEWYQQSSAISTYEP